MLRTGIRLEVEMREKTKECRIRWKKKITRERQREPNRCKERVSAGENGSTQANHVFSDMYYNG